MKRAWAWPRELRHAGILGINRRNLDLVLPQNPRALFPRVDDKLQTKQLCEQHGIPVPRTLAVIEHQGDIHHFVELVAAHEEFVVKPASGCEGRGIIVIAGRRGAEWITSSDEALTLDDLRYHLSAILSGLYSLGGQDDHAIVEQRIVRHPIFADLAVSGTPDIRVILYRGVPTMAMVRLPTKQSRGRANLHQGAIAAAIHLATGETFGGVHFGRAITAHPDTGATLAGRKIPAWDLILASATKLAVCLGLGYVGVDFVLDASGLPVVLEANARPGLAIQVAHNAGLIPRIELIEKETAVVPDLVARLAAL
jgi:alpha-L-glutamate ligase-like protein